MKSSITMEQKSSSTSSVQSESQHLQAAKLKYKMTLTPVADSSRRVLHLHGGGDVESSVVLGRNVHTGISDSSLSRDLGTVSLLSDGRMILQISKRPEHHNINLNGRMIAQDAGSELELRHGDILGLTGDRHKYRIVLSTKDPEKDDGFFVAEKDLHDKLVDAVRMESGKCIPTRDLEDKLSTSARDEIAGELYCSVCMDLLVETTVIHPCGHAFCSTCLSGQRFCPYCRKDIQYCSPMRQMDNVVLGMVKRGDFVRDDVEHYLMRAGLQLSKDELKHAKRRNEAVVIHPKRTMSGFSTKSFKRKRVGDITPCLFATEGRSRVIELGTNPITAFPALPLAGVTDLTVTPGIPFDRHAGASADDAICLD